MAERVDGVRAFVAIDFPARAKAAVSSLSRQLAGIKGRISWVKPEGVHLTLKFLGQISFPQVEQVKSALEDSVANIQPFKLNLTGLGVFPNQRSPRVIWWGLSSDSPQLNELYRQVEKQLARCGFSREKRPFTPHLTLGRVRELAQPQQLITLMAEAEIPELTPMKVNQLELMQSNLTRSGAVYNCLASFPFRG